MPPTAPMTGVRSACCCWRASAARSNGGDDVAVVDGGMVEDCDNVGVTEGDGVGVCVGVVDADEPLEMLAVGVGEGVDVTEEPVEGDGVGVGGGRNMLNGLL